MRNLFGLFLFASLKKQDSMTPVSVFGQRVSDYTFTVKLKQDDGSVTTYQGLLVYRALPYSFSVPDCANHLRSSMSLAHKLASVECADLHVLFEYGDYTTKAIAVEKNRMALDVGVVIDTVMDSLPPLYTGAL